MSDVIRTIDQIDADWLTHALRSTGTIQSSVSAVEVQTIGEGVGLMAQLARLKLTYAGSEQAPETMIAKLAVQNENKAVAQVLDFYNRETNFYRKLGKECPMRVPDSYFGVVDQEAYDFVLLMEDLGDVSPNDQLVGSSEEEAFAAVDRIAGLHARWWQKVRTPALSWMYDQFSEAEAIKLGTVLYTPSVAPTLEKFADFFTPERERIFTRVGEDFGRYWIRGVSEFETFVHGDYRQDNMIYPAGSLDAIVMDWQISGIGRGMFDVTYFICQSLQSELRVQLEKPLIERYLARLREGGVSGYDMPQAWNDYRHLVLACLVYPATVCGSLDLSNERGRLLAESMLERNMLAIEELGCSELVC
ncbi:MAG: phosphotransferase [Pseudomonadales bacterium]|nr:phosphotransferase [Pseudomonadales bacterium]